MGKKDIVSRIEENEEIFADVAKQIWDHPELGYTESFSSSLQIKVLEEAGFSVTSGLGDIPTAFVAQYGTGKPVIGILGEFDALPGLSQKVSPEYSPVVTNGPGHGCGHNLLGTAGVEAVIALKKQIDAEKLSGTIRYYGCPAEELLSGKTFMARSGAFDDLDCALTWHPWTNNFTANASMQALTAIEFFFSGRTSHAGAAPHLGRSALDAVELMNVGSNYLREHVPDGTRIHYQITNGGAAPNVVPDAASVYYFLRGKDRKQVDELEERLIKVAQGAAMMTETSVRWEIKSGCYDTLPNETLNELMFKQAEAAGQMLFTPEEEKFAKELVQTIDPSVLAAVKRQMLGGNEDSLLDPFFYHDTKQFGATMGGSSDVGDVSWITPMGQIMTTCAPFGVQLHTWQATASFGSTIGMKGMHHAAKIMALSAYELLLDPNGLLEKAKEEFAARTKGVVYKAGIPADVKPPVSNRDTVLEPTI
ncbi:aminobenzoyl-glutamate utilization protein B [Neobacillus bataviensis]|uniref:Aminobenzoyl-glutamate utilization protein B n=1 Tax=Neobacillus bataviensis TaxID=220685 RepID=A0A561D535_9BACI|nr:amidohydrolase [Neobacillus bataviensis]TWD98563.1 aminobenzoyl-glutamate utilization protein B [Neobacillus bataviensis]